MTGKAALDFSESQERGKKRREVIEILRNNLRVEGEHRFVQRSEVRLEVYQAYLRHGGEATPTGEEEEHETKCC